MTVPAFFLVAFDDADIRLRVVHPESERPACVRRRLRFHPRPGDGFAAVSEALP